MKQLRPWLSAVCLFHGICRPLAQGELQAVESFGALMMLEPIALQVTQAGDPIHPDERLIITVIQRVPHEQHKSARIVSPRQKCGNRGALAIESSYPVRSRIMLERQQFSEGETCPLPKCMF